MLLRRSTEALIVVASAMSLASAGPPVPVNGPAYIQPTNLINEDSAVLAAWQEFASAIDALVDPTKCAQDPSSGLCASSFSVGAFSLRDASASATLRYHHTGLDVVNATEGTNEVGADSVFRIGSVSKVFTAYLSLLAGGSALWDRPITDFVPELLSASAPCDGDAKVADWKRVTLGAVAGEISGIPRDAAPLNKELALLLPLMGIPDPTLAGFPPVDPSLLPPCARRPGIACPRDEYIAGITQRAPVFSPWAQPVYSNAGFTLFGLALETITGKNLQDAFTERVFGPLDMQSSSYTTPTDVSNGVIPGGNASVGFAVDAGIFGATGGMYSSTKDMAKLGLSILNSTLLDPAETRKWLKPTTHTVDLDFSVGQPWEILRIDLPSSRRVSDLYTKAGDVPGYSAYLMLSPDHGVGFSLLHAAARDNVPRAALIADELIPRIMPALETQAAREAAAKFAGTYVSNLEALNSSLTLAVSEDASVSGPGLVVTSWISNGTNLLASLPTVVQFPDLSLFPTDLGLAGKSQINGEIVFRGTFGNTGDEETRGPFRQRLLGGSKWATMDAFQYLGAGLDSFVFQLDAEGRAASVIPAALGATLIRNTVG